MVTIWDAVVVRYRDVEGERRAVDVGPPTPPAQSVACINLNMPTTEAAARAVGEAFLARQRYRPARWRDRLRLWLVRAGVRRP